MEFSEKMTELDATLKRLEDESISLEDALAEFEKGITLVKECRAYLENAKQKITLLTEDGEVPFENKKEG